MNEEFRENIKCYLGSLEEFGGDNTNPLDFCEENYVFGEGYKYTLIDVTDLSIKKLGLPTVIVNTLMHCKKLGSLTSNKYMQTSSGRLRSALDIWRHIKKYNPNVTIYEVMNCLWNSFDDMNLYSHYCDTIERRVFTIADRDDDDYDEGYENVYYDADCTDEFGLYFYDWGEL